MEAGIRMLGMKFLAACFSMVLRRENLTLPMLLKQCANIAITMKLMILSSIGILYISRTCSGHGATDINLSLG